MSDCVIYCRISRDREGTGLGVERQEADCRALADHLHLTVTRVFTDNDISAYSGKRRPDYEEMMDLVEAGQVKVILAYSNSRLTRRSKEFGRLIDAYDQHGVRIHTVASGTDDLATADGRMIAKIKADIDEADSHRISERTKRAKRQARENGSPHGGPRPYGYGPVVRTETRRNRVTGEMEIVDVRDYSQTIPGETAVIEETAHAVIDGISITSLTRNLNVRGIATSTGSPWTTRTLLRVLKRPNPDIDPDITEAVRAILDDDDRRTTPGPARRWLLTNLMTCEVGECGGRLRGSASSKGAGLGTYPAYRCVTGKHVVINAVTLDAYITVKALAGVTEKLAQREFGTDADTSVDTAPLRQEAEQLEAELKTLADELGVELDTLKRGKGSRPERLRAIQLQLATANIPSPLAVFKDLDDRGKLAVWDGLDLDRRRGIVAALMTITISKGGRGVIPRDRRWRPDLPSFDPERVHITWL